MALQDFKVKNGLIATGDISTGTSIIRGTTAATAVSLFDTSTGTIALGGSGSTVTVQNLTVAGTTTTVNSATLDVADTNITLAKNNTLDTGADGGGITLKGATNKTITYVNGTQSWDFSEHVNIASGKQYRINGTQIAASNLSNGTTGTGSVVLATTPTISTSMYVPVVYGQSATAGTLVLQANSTDTTGTVQLNSANIDSTVSTVAVLATPTSITLGGAAGAQTISIGNASTNTSTYNFATGATASTFTKTVNIGTNGVSGSTTTITVGSTGGTSSTTLNGTVKAATLTTNGVVYTSGSNGTFNSAARTLWGSTFDGSANVSGNMTGVSNITFTSGTDVSLNYAAETAQRFITIGGQVNSTSSAGTGGHVTIKGGESSATTTSATGGNVNIYGGVTSNTGAITKTTGSVYIDGGGSGASGSITYGSVYIGSQANGTTVGTSAITIGRESQTTTNILGTLKFRTTNIANYVLGSSGTTDGTVAWIPLALPSGQTSGSATSGYLQYSGTTATAGQMNGGTTVPTNTTRLNYEGYLYATKFYGDGSTLSGIVSGASLSAIAASTTYYPGLTAASTGAWTDARVATSNLYYTSGDSTLFCTNFNTSSDRNLKDNIATISNGLNIVKQMNGVEFTWRESGEKSYGVIAQEVESLLPELVKTVDDRKSVNYNALIGFLIEAVKEQQTQIDELKSLLVRG